VNSSADPFIETSDPALQGNERACPIPNSSCFLTALVASNGVDLTTTRAQYDDSSCAPRPKWGLRLKSPQTREEIMRHWFRLLLLVQAMSYIRVPGRIISTAAEPCVDDP
jgi:hypothetical protein